MLNQFFALIILLLIAPFLLLISLLIFMIDGFPVFFFQKRIGSYNTLFQIVKFRTMKIGTKDTASHLIEDPKSKYTKLGPFLRKFSIDELPQLLNIIKGDMVFIGPRPALHNQYDLIELRKTKGIHAMKPGVTGWAQVNGRDMLTINKKVNFESYYLKNRSIRLNIIILCKTIFQVFRVKNISH